MVRVVRATQVEIETAVQALRDGELVAFPTETVYGLGANAQNPAAVRKIFEAKGRPTTHPVIVHLDSQRYLHRWVSEVPELALRLAERSEEHTSELQSLTNLVCRLLLEKKNNKTTTPTSRIA